MVTSSSNYKEFLKIYKSFDVIDNPCQSYEFYDIFLKNEKNHDNYFFVYIYDSQNTLCGIVPLKKERKVFGITFYNFVGYRKTNYLGYICKDNNLEYVHKEFINFLLSNQKSYIINYYDINSTKKLYELLCNDNRVSQKIELYYCPITTLTRNFESFFKEKIKESKKRSELKKFRKKLNMLGDVKLVNIYNKETYDMYNCYIDQIYKIHNERFENVYTPSHFSDNKKRSYYDELFKRMAFSNKLFMSFLLLNNSVISFIYCLRNEKALIDLIPAFDPAFAKYNLGTVHYKELFEYLCTDTKFEYFDFSKGVSPYKTRWTDITTKNYQFLVPININFIGKIYLKLERNYFKLKSKMRKTGILKKIKFILGNFIKEDNKTDKNYETAIINYIDVNNVTFENHVQDNVDIYKKIKYLSVEQRKQILNAVYDGKKVDFLNKCGSLIINIYSQTKETL